MRRKTGRGVEMDFEKWARSVRRLPTRVKSPQRASLAEEALDNQRARWHLLWMSVGLFCSPSSARSAHSYNVVMVASMDTIYGFNSMDLPRLTWLTPLCMSNLPSAEINVGYSICHRSKGFI